MAVGFSATQDVFGFFAGAFLSSADSEIFTTESSGSISVESVAATIEPDRFHDRRHVLGIRPGDLRAGRQPCHDDPLG